MSTKGSTEATLDAIRYEELVRELEEVKLRVGKHDKRVDDEVEVYRTPKDAGVPPAKDSLVWRIQERQRRGRDRRAKQLAAYERECDALRAKRAPKLRALQERLEAAQGALSEMEARHRSEEAKASGAIAKLRAEAQELELMPAIPDPLPETDPRFFDIQPVVGLNNAGLPFYEGRPAHHPANRDWYGPGVPVQ